MAHRPNERSGGAPAAPPPVPVPLPTIVPLPPYPPLPNPVQQVTPRDVLDRTGSQARDSELQVAAENAPIRFTYGLDQINAEIVDVLASGGKWIFVLFWGEGPAAGVQTLYLDQKPVPAEVIVTHYTGAPGQGIDATLAAAYAAQTPAVTYADTLDGIAYSVAVVPPELLSGQVSFSADFRGLLLPGLHLHPISDVLAYTRANAHSAYDLGGVMRSLAANVMPLDYHPVTHAARGIQVFTGKTNLCTSPEDFSTTWTTAASPGDTTVTTNVAGVICPDGSQTADKIIAGAGSG